MEDINIRFKDVPPEKTVEHIRGILGELGIEIEESWTNSGIENCWSLRVAVKDAPRLGANGKGVSRALARASAYGEFIERLQCGMMLYKYQSITRDPVLNLQMYAPDGKFMTKKELVEHGEWMDPVIAEYGGGLTREKIAKLCYSYACTEEDKILCLPFYSVFEDKYVYLPAGFVEHIYSANGCCAGNSREEAWIHAFSEIIERRSMIKMITSGKAAPVIPDSVIRQFPTAAKILDTVRKNEKIDVQLFDFSQGIGFPVIATRIIEKNANSYLVNICADPVLEIAIDRTLTEMFQGKTLDNFASKHRAKVWEEVSGMSVAHNILNQMETGNGLFSINFFTEDVSCSEECSKFEDHSNKTNKELLQHMLAFMKKLGYPLYVRNYSFLGFPSYQFVMPGFSESRGMRLTEPVCEFAIGDAVHTAFRNVDAADKTDLLLMLSYYKKLGTIISKKNNFRGLAGLPLNLKYNAFLALVTLACAAYKTGNISLSGSYVNALLKLKNLEKETYDYFQCVCHYMSLLPAKVSAEKIRCLLSKIYDQETVAELYSCIEQDKTPFDKYLMRCDTVNCDKCIYRSECSYERYREIFKNAGKRYKNFTQGQNREYLAV